MSYKKYLDDYRVEEYTNERGRIKSRAVYKGDFYEIKPGVSISDKRIILAAAAVSWAAFIGALAQNTNSARLIYVLVPFVCTAIPLVFTAMAAISLYRAKAVMTREQADKTAGRLPVNSALAMIFSGSALTAYLISALIRQETMTSGDIAFTVLSLVTTLTAAAVFIKSRKHKPCKTEETKTKVQSTIGGKVK